MTDRAASASTAARYPRRESNGEATRFLKR